MKDQDCNIARRNQDESDHHHLIPGHRGGLDSFLHANHVSSQNVDEILLQFPGSNTSYRKLKHFNGEVIFGFTFHLKYF